MKLFNIVFIITSISLCFTLFLIRRYFGTEKKAMIFMLCSLTDVLCYGVLLYEHVNNIEDLSNRLIKAGVFIIFIIVFYVFYIWYLKKRQQADRQLVFSILYVLQIFMMGVCTLFLLYFFMMNGSGRILEVGMYCMEHLLLFCIISGVLALLRSFLELRHTSVSLTHSMKRIRRNG